MYVSRLSYSHPQLDNKGTVPEQKKDVVNLLLLVGKGCCLIRYGDDGASSETAMIGGRRFIIARPEYSSYTYKEE